MLLISHRRRKEPGKGSRKTLRPKHRTADTALYRLVEIMPSLQSFPPKKLNALNSFMRKRGIKMSLEEIKEASSKLCENYRAEKQGKSIPFALTPKEEIFLLRQMRLFLNVFNEAKA